MKDTLKNYGFLALVAGVIIALDQWSKYAIRTTLAKGEIWSPWEWLTPYARIVHWDNSGVAFGLFQGSGQIFMILAIVVAIIIIYYYPRIAGNDWILKVAMSLQLAGAVGNLIDRMMLNGRVTDFISVGDFPVFNVADASISVGVAILLIGVWVQEQREKKSTAEQQTAETLIEEPTNHSEMSG